MPENYVTDRVGYRKVTDEEDRVLEILEYSELEEAQVAEIMGILIRLTDKFIMERDRECPACMARFDAVNSAIDQS